MWRPTVPTVLRDKDVQTEAVCMAVVRKLLSRRLSRCRPQRLSRGSSPCTNPEAAGWSYFTEPWCMALLHDRFIDLRKELRQVLASEQVTPFTVWPGEVQGSKHPERTQPALRPHPLLHAREATVLGKNLNPEAVHTPLPMQTQPCDFPDEEEEGLPSIEQLVRQIEDEEVDLKEEPRNYLRRVFEDTIYRPLVEKSILDYLHYNRYHLPMYAWPGII
ncbi:hypothetical protein H920_09580 [Fukomys damarensis]|uniref:Uncharacterized protein n=1 Tax=Fukomys damarensis TaxID=885580 RepID=A0A091DEY1_FUKDA|nr:hypothetical protein H920_09580 [Fukomys damarensis]